MDQKAKDIYFLQETILLAISESEDRLSQNAAILVAEDGRIAAYANKMPTGVKDLPDRHERPRKYDFHEHAEAGAIHSAARAGIKTLGSTIYCPFYSCPACSRAIVVAGVKR